MEVWKVEYDRRVTAAFDDAWGRLMANPAQRLSLYYKPSGEYDYGELRFFADGEEVPDGFQWAPIERHGAFPSHLDKSAALAAVQASCRRLPMLPFAQDQSRSISDDDLCHVCRHCKYQPGGRSTCGFWWPGQVNADGYVVRCPQFKR